MCSGGWQICFSAQLYMFREYVLTMSRKYHEAVYAGTDHASSFFASQCSRPCPSLLALRL